MAYPRFLRARQHKFLVANSGTFNSLTAGTKTAINGSSWDLTLLAAVGDVLEAGISFVWSSDSTAGQGIVDIGTIVSGSAVNWMSGIQATGFSGLEGTLGEATTGLRRGVEGTARYTVQAGDISSGKVTVRPFYVVTGGTKVMAVDSTNALQFWVKNLGPVSPH